MFFHKRLIENKVIRIFNNFKAVFLTGPRQVGKSTLLEKTFPDLKNFTFDPVQDLFKAKEDPDLFLENFKPPLILDEIQFVPELFPALKRKIDKSDKKGQYLLTGSSNLSMLKNLSESLAGRIASLNLYPLTIYEIENISLQENWLQVYLDNPNNLCTKFSSVLTQKQTLFESIWRGGFPGLLNLENDLIQTFFSSYIQTYLERDIRLIEEIKELSNFARFLSLIAAFTGQEINEAHLGREINMSPKTAHRWKELLKHNFLWFELPPYHGNAIKRIAKKSKGYFFDTGLACYLQRISSPEALAASPLLGALFETWVFSHILVLSELLTISPKFYHWRTSSGCEVDVVLEYNGFLYPVEIKAKTNLSKRDTSGIKAFFQTYKNVQEGLILYAGNECFKVSSNIIAMPWNALINF